MKKRVSVETVLSRLCSTCAITWEFGQEGEVQRGLNQRVVQAKRVIPILRCPICQREGNAAASLQICDGQFYNITQFVVYSVKGDGVQG